MDVGEADGGPAPDKGEVTTEYVLLILFITVVIAVTVLALGQIVLGFFNDGIEKVQ